MPSMRIRGKNMNKKILIGSIIAVVVLIGVSFTSVVGYNNVVSDVKASPLFNIRSSRAIDEESEDFSCEYVGKGEEINIQIPKRNSYGFLINRALNRLLEMDKDSVINFINKFIKDRKIWIDNFKNMGYINESQSNKNNLFTVNTFVCDSEFPIPSIFVVYEDVCLIQIIVALLIASIVGPILVTTFVLYLATFLILGVIGVTFLVYRFLFSAKLECPPVPTLPICP